MNNKGDTFGLGIEAKTPLEEKQDVLYEAMYSEQPQLEDFRGKPGYSEEEINADEEWLERKKKEIRLSERKAANDEFADQMEPLVTYILGNDRLFTTRENYAFLASDYDDKSRGTDIVLGLKKRRTNKRAVLSVDVASGTNINNIRKKFNRGLDQHDGVATIKYCKHNDDTWREPDAMHLVLGMSPASHSRAMEKVVVENGELRGRMRDQDSDFMILSEIFEQIQMQRAILRNKPADEKNNHLRETTDDLVPAVFTALANVLGVRPKDYNSDEEVNQAVVQEYDKAASRLARFDDVYYNILTTARERKAEANKYYQQRKLGRMASGRR